MYTLTLLSFFKDEDYEVRPLNSNNKLFFVRKYFHRPKLKPRKLEDTVDTLVNFWVEGDGSIVSENDIIAINYREHLEFTRDGWRTYLKGEVHVKGKLLDYNSDYRQNLINKYLKKHTPNH